MNIIPAAIASPFLSLFYILTMRKCINAFFIPAPKKLPIILVWTACYFFQVFLNMFGPFLPVIILFLNMSFVFLVTSISYSESLKKCAIFSFLICAIWMLVEIIVHMILNMLHLDDKSGFAGSIISKIIMLVFAIVTGHCLQRRNTGDISVRYMVILLTVPAGSIYIMHNIFLISNQSEDELLFSFVSGILLLFINYVIFEVFESLAENTEYQKKTLLYEQQLNLCNQQAKEREAQNAEIRLLRHDIKQHMTSLLGLVESDKKTEASQYITTLLETSTSKKKYEISCSGNIIVDSLVNYKSAIAQNENIRFSANIFIPTILPFQSGNLTIILGNLLENALEACRYKKNGNPWIELQMSYQKELLYIVVANTFEGKRYQNSQKQFQTTKHDQNAHGLGILSVEQAVATYNGELRTEINGEIFKAVVILYESEEK